MQVKEYRHANLNGKKAFIGRGGMTRQQRFADEMYRLLVHAPGTPWKHIGPQLLARNTGVAAATFYQHFSDSDELFFELVKQLRETSCPLPERVALVLGLLEFEMRNK